MKRFLKITFPGGRTKWPGSLALAPAGLAALHLPVCPRPARPAARGSRSDDEIARSNIAADNRYGTILDVTAGGTPAVTGDSGADTFTTTHPWANFSY